MIRYGSVCSGIEAASVAWEPLGWLPQFYSEIEPFPCAVLHEHWSSGRPRFMPDPDELGLSDDDRKVRKAAIKSVSALPEQANGVPNYGDMTQFEEWPDAAIDVLIGGTPCQSYSVAGLRKGLDDPRGDLMLTYVAIARRYRPRWVVWENVFGVLSSNGGRDFASLLGLLSGRRIGVPSGGWKSSGIVEGYRGAYGLSWRVLDTQFVRVDGAARALPQRRRRVFVVGHIGADWRRAAAVLLERQGLSGDSAPRRKAGEGVAPTISARPSGGGGLGTDFDLDGGLTTVFGGGPDNGRITGTVSSKWAKGSGGPAGDEAYNLVGLHREEAVPAPVAYSIMPQNSGKDYKARQVDVAQPILAGGPTGGNQGGDYILDPIAFSAKDEGADADVGVSPTLRAMGSRKNHSSGGGQVAIAFDTTQITSDKNFSSPKPGDPCHPIAAKGHPPAVAFDMRGREGGAMPEGPHETANIRASDGGSSRSYIAEQWAVRRLTPTECARLQGFDDHHCRIPWRGKPAEECPDGPQYKAYGNSMSTNVMRWIGERIQFVDQIKPADAA